MWGSAILAIRQKVTAESWEVMRRLQNSESNVRVYIHRGKTSTMMLTPPSLEHGTWGCEIWNLSPTFGGVYDHIFQLEAVRRLTCAETNIFIQYTLNNTCPPILSQACSKNRRRPWKRRSSCHETQKKDNQAVKIHFYMENVVNLKPNKTTGSCGIWSLLLSFRTCATTWQSSRLDHLFPRKQRLPSLETKPRHVAIVRLSRTHCPVSGWKPWRRVSAPGSGAGSRTWLAMQSKSSKKAHVTKNS